MYSSSINMFNEYVCMALKNLKSKKLFNIISLTS